MDEIPVPETMMVSGELVALLVRINLPETAVIATGLKRNVSFALTPGAMIKTFGRTENTVSADVMLVMRSVSLPVLVIVTVVSLNSPSLTFPNENVFALKLISVDMPVPETEIVSEELEALLATMSFPVTAPRALGLNRSVSFALVPGGIVSAFGLPENIVSAEKTLLILSVSLPVLAIVTVVSLNSPTLTLPNDTVAVFNCSAAVPKPFPETWIVSGDDVALL